MRFNSIVSDCGVNSASPFRTLKTIVNDHNCLRFGTIFDSVVVNIKLKPCMYAAVGTPPATFNMSPACLVHPGHCHQVHYNTSARMHKSGTPGRLGDKIFYGAA
jgi:hypothetical protein